MHPLGEIEVVAPLRDALVCDVEEFLHHEVVTEVRDGEQALEARVHVAIKCVVLEADDAVLIRRCRFVLALGDY